ncbi:MAG TPA: metal-dependent hydrolase [Steroidobacteraceae bacterium]|nr:metal-dependent hydrolase [Steroidobacteraceae bacterium]
MDSITHSLVGVLIGETASRCVSVSPSGLAAESRRNAFVWVMGIGSNLPDADLLVSFGRGDRLEYLLQHRGYTHTVLGALAGAALIYLALEVILRLRGLAPSRQDRLWLALLAALGPLLHLAMDFTNSYGVHPFWPLDNGWRYGDSVFIAEPLIWAAATPLLFVLRSLLARILVGAALLLSLLAAAFSGLAPLGGALTLAALIGAMWVVSRRTLPRTALCVGIGLWISVTAVFVGAGRAAAGEIRDYSTLHFPRAVLLDHALTPMPADPLCWEVLLVQLEGERYIARRGVLSLVPAFIPPARCRDRIGGASTAGALQAVEDAGSAGLLWRGEFSMSRDSLAQLAAQQCIAAAFLRFARVPWAIEGAAGWQMGDLRFDRPGGRGISSLSLTPGCPRDVPPWVPPRADLLR